MTALLLLSSLTSQAGLSEPVEPEPPAPGLSELVEDGPTEQTEENRVGDPATPRSLPPIRHALHEWLDHQQVARPRFAFEPTQPAAPLAPAPSLVFAGYVPDYRLFEFSAARGRGFTDVIFFSLQPGEDGALLDEFGLTPRLSRVAPTPRPYRALIALGGGQRSRHFAPMASNPDARARFIAAVVKLVDDAELDGVDLDWEHVETARELAAYEAFVLELRRALGARLFTIAVSDPRLLTPLVVGSVDRVHLMAYDGPRHATIEQARSLVDAALRRGVRPERLCLGIPLFATGRGARSPSPWREVIRRHKPAPTVDEVEGLKFSGLETTRAKVRWINERRLGGLFFWELTQDAEGDASLIETARDELRAVERRR